MPDPFSFCHRRFPRFLTRSLVQVTPRGERRSLSGVLCDLSEEGCGLRLDEYLGPGTPLEIRCNISGLALCLRGDIVWSDALGGLFHGVAITGFASKADALFHSQYLNRLARKA